MRHPRLRQIVDESDEVKQLLPNDVPTITCTGTYIALPSPPSCTYSQFLDPTHSHSFNPLLQTFHQRSRITQIESPSSRANDDHDIHEYGNRQPSLALRYLQKLNHSTACLREKILASVVVFTLDGQSPPPIMAQRSPPVTALYYPNK